MLQNGLYADLYQIEEGQESEVSNNQLITA